jgi:ribonuclease P protein subunit POP4
MDSDAPKKTELLNPYYTDLQLSTNLSNPFTPTYVTSNLSLSSDPTGMYVSRVKGRQIPLKNPARESRAMKELEKKRMRKRRDKEKKNLGIIGKREAKEKGVWTFDKAQAKFVLLFSCGCIFDHGEILFLEF